MRGLILALGLEQHLDGVENLDGDAHVDKMRVGRPKCFVRHVALLFLIELCVQALTHHAIDTLEKGGEKLVAPESLHGLHY